VAVEEPGVATVRSVVVARLPRYPIESVVRVGDGLDNVAYEVSGELIVRFSKHPDPARLDREVRLLAAVAEIAPLPVPVPAFTVAELGCLAYFRLAGTPLLDLPHHPSGHGASIAATLGQFLTALHAVPAARMTNLVDIDDHPLNERRQEAGAAYQAVARQIPSPHRRSVESFLDARPPDGRYVPVFSHNDLGIEHVLVDPVTWEVTGVIDWSDAAIADPAHDFGLLYRDLGPDALRAAIDSYRTAPEDLVGLRDRAVFHARCGLLEDLAYGFERGRPAYIGKSLAAMAWLFPA
jgi:aminoglycoside phosphotransferase (APT) family kinase protein